jgi:hypothetical protein
MSRACRFTAIRIGEMGHGRNKYQSRENRARACEILMRDWDPIGVAGIAEATDEYDAYADKAYVMLMNERASAEAIAAYLFDIATRRMGLSHIPDVADRSDRAARTLIAMRSNFETH